MFVRWIRGESNPKIWNMTPKDKLMLYISTPLHHRRILNTRVEFFCIFFDFNQPLGSVERWRNLRYSATAENISEGEVPIWISISNWASKYTGHDLQVYVESISTVRRRPVRHLSDKPNPQTSPGGGNFTSSYHSLNILVITFWRGKDLDHSQCYSILWLTLPLSSEFYAGGIHQGPVHEIYVKQPQYIRESGKKPRMYAYFSSAQYSSFITNENHPRHHLSNMFKLTFTIVLAALFAEQALVFGQTIPVGGFCTSRFLFHYWCMFDLYHTFFFDVSQAPVLVVQSYVLFSF